MGEREIDSPGLPACHGLGASTEPAVRTCNAMFFLGLARAALSRRARLGVVPEIAAPAPAASGRGRGRRRRAPVRSGPWPPRLARWRALPRSQPEWHRGRPAATRALVPPEPTPR